MKNHHVITIGTSAGGLNALKTLLRQLPPDFPASVHIVQHLSSQISSNLPLVLEKAGQLPVKFALDGEPIESGRVYLAPPDFHLILEPDRLRVIRGPRENRMRPAIDPLFRSAAAAYRSYATGVILTGMLDDGTVGLQAIKACGGMAVVQNPEEAEYRSMPQSAIALVDVDRVVSVEDLGDVLMERVRQTPPVVETIPPHLLLEVPIVRDAITKPKTMAEIGKPTAQSCPSCGGPLWQIGEAEPLRYRCHIGHAFTKHALIEEQSEATEKALWTALRTLEERSRLLANMSEHYAQKGSEYLAEVHQQRSEEAYEHAVQIRNLIRNLKVIVESSTNEKRKAS